MLRVDDLNSQLNFIYANRDVADGAAAEISPTLTYARSGALLARLSLCENRHRQSLPQWVRTQNTKRKTFLEHFFKHKIGEMYTCSDLAQGGTGDIVHTYEGHRRTKKSRPFPTVCTGRTQRPPTCLSTPVRCLGGCCFMPLVQPNRASTLFIASTPHSFRQTAGRSLPRIAGRGCRRCLSSVMRTSTATIPEPPRTKLAEKYGPWAVVTGASSGIGAEFARQLAVAGISVLLVARREARLRELADMLRHTCDVEADVAVADLATSNGVGAVVAACTERNVGLLVNNAGVELHGSFFHQSVESHRACLALNVTAVTELAHAFGRRFCEQGRGGIIFVSSISSGGMPWFATYSSSKAYVTSLALTLRDEMLRSGVDVLALEPGLVVSEMTLEPGQEEHGYGSYLMATDICVREALEVFGRRAVYTPGLRYRIIKNLLYALPRTFALWLLAEYYKSVMDPKMFEYHKAIGDATK